MALSPESYREPLPPSYRADVQTIYRNCQHLVSLVDDILDLSQIEAQHWPLVKDHVDLNQDVVLKSVEIVQPLAERKGLALSLGLAGGLPASCLADTSAPEASLAESPDQRRASHRPWRYCGTHRAGGR